MQNIPLKLNYDGSELTGFAVPLIRSNYDKPEAFDIIINKAFLGTLRITSDDGRMDTAQDPILVKIITDYLRNWYQPVAGIKAIYTSSSMSKE